MLLWYTKRADDGDYATGLMNYDKDPGKVIVSGNTFVETYKIDGPVKTIRNVHGSYTAAIRARGVTIHFKSEAQPDNTVIGMRLHWVLKVDGRMTLSLRQGFSDHDDSGAYFASGKHRVEIWKNGMLVRTLVIKV